MTDTTRRSALRRGAVALLLLGAAPAFATTARAAEEKPTTRLFKVVTVKDEIVIGLDTAELTEIGGADAGAVASALKHNGTLTAWQYAVKKAQNGDLQQAPLRKVGLIASDSLRVEPLTTPLAVLPHE